MPRDLPTGRIIGSIGPKDEPEKPDAHCMLLVRRWGPEFEVGCPKAAVSVRGMNFGDVLNAFLEATHMRASQQIIDPKDPKGLGRRNAAIEVCRTFAAEIRNEQFVEEESGEPRNIEEEE